MAHGAAPAEPVYSQDHNSIFAAEKAHLGVSTDAGGRSEPIFGLALSGGGIRSASFALGVLQALYGFGAFEKFHYLSTVSGGGYIGSALTYFRNAFLFPDPHKEGQFLDWFPFGYLRGASNIRAMGARTEKPSDPARRRAYDIVAFLRQHASFLTPSRMLNKPALVAGVLRGLVSTVLPYMLILVGALGALLAANFFDLRFGFHGFERASALSVLDDDAVPAPYLAMIPASIVAVILLFAFAGALCSVLASSKASAVPEEPDALKRYKDGIHAISRIGRRLVLCGALLLAALLPWLHDFLDSLASKGGDLPTSFAALFAALAGAAAQVEKLRAIVGGSQRPPSALKSIGMVVAGIALVFGVVLLAYIIAFHLVDAAYSVLAWLALDNPYLEIPLATAALGFVGAAGYALARCINVNHASQHRIYRDRLMEVFCAEEKAIEGGRWLAAERAQQKDGWLTSMRSVKRPLHLINTTMIATDSNDRKFRGRGGDNFLLSPLYCGSDATGWVKTELGMNTLSIATAAAVSGAALNAHAGPHGSGGLRNKAYAALLSFLGLNLGYWAANPSRYKESTPPKVPMPNLIRPGFAALSGRRLDERGTHVLLSDGGHFENLAIYELIRRKVRFLWVSDAGQDVGFGFEDLANAIERVRVDFGVNIRFREEAYDLTQLLPGSAETKADASKNFAAEYKLAKRGYAIGTIEYPDDEPDKHGVIVYVKSTLTRFLPGDLYGYKKRNPDFPHQTTLDQFFDEDQFEAYRELGYRLAAQLFRDVEASCEQDLPLPPGLDTVATTLGFYPRSKSTATVLPPQTSTPMRSSGAGL
jgi:Patatin-like phospholipase